MNFAIQHYACLEEVALKDGIKDLIDVCGSEFVPPLSERTSTEQQNFQKTAKNEHSYYEMLLNQPVFIAFETEMHKIAGFMSYLPGQIHNHLSGYNPSNYISTIIVAPCFRRYGVARLLYDAMIGKSGLSTVTTRTWSSNESHIRLLEQIGFRLVHKLLDHRSPGIHTVYYGRKVE